MEEKLGKIKVELSFAKGGDSFTERLKIGKSEPKALTLRNTLAAALALQKVRIGRKEAEEASFEVKYVLGNPCIFEKPEWEESLAKIEGLPTHPIQVPPKVTYRWISAILLGVGVGWLFFSFLPTWIHLKIKDLRSHKAEVRRNAMEYFVKIGKPAVPILRKHLGDDAVQWQILKVLYWIQGTLSAESQKVLLRGKTIAQLPENLRPYIYRLLDRDWKKQKEAAEALSKMGPKAAAAVPALIQALKDIEWRVRKSMAEALAKIGPPAVPALIQALKDSDRYVRWEAAVALGYIGSKAAVPALIRALKDREVLVRWAAAQALGEIGPQPAAAVPALIRALKDREVLVRWTAAWALGKIGPKAAAAVPALIQALKDSDWCVRLAAAYALLAITQKPHAQAQEILLKGLENQPEKTLSLLAELGSKANFAAQTLKSLLHKEKEPQRRKQIQQILQKLHLQKSKEGQENGK